MKFYLVHSVGNRMRFRTDSVMSNATARLIFDEVGAIDGITGVKVNPLTGSVLVTFATAEARTRITNYLADLETNPPAKRSLAHRMSRKASVVAVRETIAERVEAAEDNPFLKGLSNLMSRAVTEMPVLKTAAAPFRGKPGEDAADLDLSPVARWLVLRPVLPMLVNIANVFLGAIPYFFRGVGNLLRGKLNVEVLDAAAIAVSLLLRDFKTAGLVILLLGLGEMLERYTRKKSLASLADQLALKVDQVWVRRGSEVVAMPFKVVTANDRIVVRRC